jgi:hypothetical protein
MGYKIEISNRDFKDALKSTKVLKKLGKKNIANERVGFTFDGGMLRVLVISAERFVSALGDGTGTAFISLVRYQALQKVPPIADPVKIEYDDIGKKLIIGTTSFPTIE